MEETYLLSQQPPGCAMEDLFPICLLFSGGHLPCQHCPGLDSQWTVGNRVSVLGSSIPSDPGHSECPKVLNKLLA